MQLPWCHEFIHTIVYTLIVKAIDKIRSSLKGDPIICAPTGILSLVNPIGILIAVEPVLLNTIVFRSKA
jgi:hypothetical protein